MVLQHIGDRLTTVIIYLCPNCSNTVKPPGQAGRSWCKSCENYLIPIQEEGDSDAHTEHQVSPVYVYTSWTPAPSRMEQDERPDHKFAFTKRRDRMSKSAKSTVFQGRCTCKHWKDEGVWTSRRMARAHWQKHMVEVENQQVLSV